MKSILVAFAFLLCLGKTMAQITQPIPNVVKQYANAAGDKLKKCCSSAGGRDQSVDIASWEVNKVTERIKIILTVSWYGSFTGTRYWIKGKLVCDLDGCNPTWEKMEDSKGFSSGCSQNCIKGCLE
jgi:hypothetical protein